MRDFATSKPRPDWGSIQAAADRLGCTTRTVRRMISRGDLAAYRVGPRLIRVDLNEVDNVLRPIPTAGNVA